MSYKKRFLVESLFIYNSLFKNRVALASSYRSLAQSALPKRQEVLSHLNEAILLNNELLRDIIQSLKLQCTVDEIVEHGFYQSRFQNESNDLHAYLKDLKYLRRDWSGLEQGEREIEMIVSPLKKEFKKYLKDNGDALFLGAGLGRIAWEHNDLFDTVNALDKSYSMVYLFHKLLEEDIDFYEVNESNVYNAKDSAKKYRASIRNGSEAAFGHRYHFKYVVGDVLELPYLDRSQSVVVSVYFTDVIALSISVMLCHSFR